MLDALGASNYANVALRQGLSFWGATSADDPTSSRSGAPPDFSVLEFSYTRYQPITDAISVKGAVLGQISDPLFSSQLFYLGGAAFGPGYYSGDNGIAGSIELRFDQRVTGDWLHGYQLYSFLDAGQVWNRGDETQKLASIGVGVRFNLWDELYASIGYAVPISQSSKTEEFTSSGRLFRFRNRLNSALSGANALPLSPFGLHPKYGALKAL